MKRLLAAFAVVALTAFSGTAASAQPARGAVYVVSQGLCYETFAAAESLPPHGPFQLITPSTLCGPGGSMTPFGPGDPDEQARERVEVLLLLHPGAERSRPAFPRRRGGP